MSQNKILLRSATLLIAKVLHDISLSVAKKRRVTAKPCLLKIASLMTVSFRASWDHIHNSSVFVFLFLFESILKYYWCCHFSFSKHAY